MTMKDANAIIDEVIAGENPLDKFMRSDPVNLSVEKDYPEIVAILRKDRAAFIKAQSDKKDKKAGVPLEDTEENASEQD